MRVQESKEAPPAHARGGPRGLPALPPRRPTLRLPALPGPEHSTQPSLPLNLLAHTATRGPLLRWQGGRLLRGVVGLAALFLFCRCACWVGLRLCMHAMHQRCVSHALCAARLAKHALHACGEGQLLPAVHVGHPCASSACVPCRRIPTVFTGRYARLPPRIFELLYHKVAGGRERRLLQHSYGRRRIPVLLPAAARLDM